jgi:GST-like protein
VIDLYYWPTPNGQKVLIYLEEAGLPYRLLPLDIDSGEQLFSSYDAIAPTHKMPAIVDRASAELECA